MTGDAIVQVIEAVKRYDGEKKDAVKNITFDIKRGEFLTILGPSGCGKTTTLRMMAGFETPTTGKILIDNEDVSNKPPYARSVNTVFQNYALFPHMNIYDNIAFGLNIKKLPKDEIKEKVSNMLKMVRLEGYENKMPNQLSGGQKQRVAIARAIVNNPKVLLLDEPLGALDLKLRKQMQLELKHLQKELGITFVYVTHDQEEALTMSDRIAVMNDGHVEQLATPEEIYERPKTKFVADFIGETNIIEGIVLKIDGLKATVQLEDKEELIVDNDEFSIGDEICIAIRPERITLKEKPSEGDAWMKGYFKERIYVGSMLKTVIEIPNERKILVNETVGQIFDLNEDSKEIYATWNPQNAMVIKS